MKGWAEKIKLFIDANKAASILIGYVAALLLGGIFVVDWRVDRRITPIQEMQEFTMEKFGILDEFIKYQEQKEKFRKASAPEDNTRSVRIP